MGFGLKSSEMVEGLYPGGVTVCSKHYFSKFDYDGTVKPPVTVLCVDMEPEDSETEPFTQRFACGKGLEPTKDGESVEAAAGSKKTGLSSQSGAGMYLRSLMKPIDNPTDGFPEAEVTNQVSVFNGVKALLKRIERDRPKGGSPQKGGLTGKDQKKESEGPLTVLVVSELLERPSGGKKKAAAGKSKAAAVVDDEDTGVEADPATKKKASKLVVALLKQHEDGLSMMEIGKIIFKQLKGDEDQAIISQLLADEGYMGGDAVPWSVEDDVVKL